MELFSGEVLWTVVDADVVKGIPVDEVICKNAEELMFDTTLIEEPVVID